VTLPAGVIRPLLLPPRSVNQRLPSKPVVIDFGSLGNSKGPDANEIPSENWVTSPVGVIRPIPPVGMSPPPPANVPPCASVNHRSPSTPTVIPPGPTPLPRSDTGNSVTVPVGVMRPIRLPLNSVNQRLPFQARRDLFGFAVGADPFGELGHFAYQAESERVGRRADRC
jgi:hypothetical protein